MVESQSGDDDTYIWCVYQIAGLLLQDLSRMKDIANDIKNGKIGWKSETYSAIADKIAEYDDFLVNPFTVVEGVCQCPKCGSAKTFSTSKQTRSQDESTTIFCRCSNCNNKWIYNN
jgi:DNA-directed RNA polymerase subunit M/transcription elongation factor TFIIS